MRHGIEDIDTMFGVGYAKAHPELLAAYMRTAAALPTGASMASSSVTRPP